MMKTILHVGLTIAALNLGLWIGNSFVVTMLQPPAPLPPTTA
jgi:hypothetical protein